MFIYVWQSNHFLQGAENISCISLALCFAQDICLDQRTFRNSNFNRNKIRCWQLLLEDRPERLLVWHICEEWVGRQVELFKFFWREVKHCAAAGKQETLGSVIMQVEETVRHVQFKHEYAGKVAPVGATWLSSGSRA
jgi:hypothetical protein